MYVKYIHLFKEEVESTTEKQRLGRGDKSGSKQACKTDRRER